jgi:hypothetical protein
MKTNDRPFEGVLGNTVELRVLERLIASPGTEFNVAELSAMTGVHRDSASKVINKFLKWNVLVRTTKGKMDFYRLNSDELLVISISAMNDALIMQMIPDVKTGMDAMEEGSLPAPIRDEELSEREIRIDAASRMAKQKNAGILERLADL